MEVITEILIHFSLILIMLLLPIALIIFSVKRQNKVKKCVHCAETIKNDAVVCRFCGFNLTFK